MKLFNAYCEDGHHNVTKYPVLAENFNEVEKKMQGQGKIVHMARDTDYYVDTDELTRKLIECGYEMYDVDVIVQLIERFKLDKNALPFD